LRRLKVDRIDLWQLHRIDPAVPEAEQFGAIQEFLTEGKIRNVGLSEVSTDQIDRARQAFPVVSVQNRYNLAERQADPVLDYCEGNQIAFIPWYPLLAGTLDQRAQGGGALASIADAHGATPMQIAIAWLLGRSSVMLPIPGTSRVDHLDENVAAAAIKLSPDEMSRLG
jgi:pyridoxine 4-dehydrogenase